MRDVLALLLGALAQAEPAAVQEPIVTRTFVWNRGPGSNTALRGIGPRRFAAFSSLTTVDMPYIWTTG